MVINSINVRKGNFKMKKRLKKGFTLVELVVVIAIIAILSAVSVAGYFGFTTNARKTATKQEAKDIANLILVVAADEETTGVTNDGTKVTLTYEVVTEDSAVATGKYKSDADALIAALATAGWTMPTDAKLTEVIETGVTNGATDKEIKTLKYEHNNFAYTITVGTGDVAFVA